MSNEGKVLAELLIKETYNDSAISIDQKFVSNDSIVIIKNKILRIGRSDNNTITIDHPAVSNNHCIIWPVQFDDDSIPLIYLKDVSLNGSFINGVKMEKNQIYLFNNYDVLSIEYGISIQYVSIYGDNEDAVGNCLIEDNKICTDFDNWSVKSRILGNGTFGYVILNTLHDTLFTTYVTNRCRYLFQRGRMTQSCAPSKWLRIQ
jgi:meiosis-specific serine/threonine-protein kinase MEK1